MTIQCIHASPQWITCEVSNHATLEGTRITFVYRSKSLNSSKERITLWKYLTEASFENANASWLIMRDFNAILRPSDRSGGDSRW